MTRQEYITNSSELYHPYYAQFIPPLRSQLREFIKEHWDSESLKSCYEKDKNLNNLPLCLPRETRKKALSKGVPEVYSAKPWMVAMDLWTLKNRDAITSATRGTGEGFSLSTGVCIIKAFMRELIAGEESI